MADATNPNEAGDRAATDAWFRVMWNHEVPDGHCDGYADGEFEFRALVEFKDGGTTELVGTDGGEPEDQTFGRDWKWVPDRLNAEVAARKAAEEKCADLWNRAADLQDELAALTERAEKAESAIVALTTPDNAQLWQEKDKRIAEQDAELAALRGRLEAHHARTDLPGTLGCPICARGQAAEGE